MREAPSEPRSTNVGGHVERVLRDLRELDAFRSAGWGIAIGSADGTTLEVINHMFAQMHGYAVRELEGAPILSVFAPEAHAGLPAEMARAHLLGRHEFESIHLRKDGSTFPVMVDVTTVKDPAGAVLYRVVNVQDLTERRRQAEAVSISREVLDTLLEGCQVISFDYRYLYCNELAANHGRTTREALLGRRMSECYPGIETTPMFATLRRAMTERTAETMENEFTFPNGSRITFELRFVPIKQGVCILSLDVTERRHQLAAIVNDSDDAIIGSNLTGVVTSWNGGAARLFGYPASEMIGQPLTRLVPPELAPEEAMLLGRVVAGERVPPFETVRRCANGQSVEISLSLSIVRNADGTVIGIAQIARDITELKTTQRALAAAKAATDAANRELEAFSYSVAHDLRAPLRGINGFSQALLEDHAGQLDAEGARYLRLVRESAHRMGEFIDDILHLSKMSRQELVRSEVDLSELALSAFARLASVDPARRVVVDIAAGLTGEGDPRLLAVVIQNLMDNAWKFTSRRSDARIEVGVRDHVYFVRDNGAGFEMSRADKLFGLFQRMHLTSEFEGTGVGLATVHRIITRHGGRVWADSAPGTGTTIYFTLGAVPGTRGAGGCD